MIIIFWEMTPCGSYKNRRFGGSYRLHLQGERDEQVQSETVSSNLRQYNMVASPKGLGPDKDCSGTGQQHIQKTDPSSRQRGRPTKNKTVTVKQ
jgi:hypothetical protein